MIELSNSYNKFRIGSFGDYDHSYITVELDGNNVRILDKGVKIITRSYLEFTNSDSSYTPSNANDVEALINNILATFVNSNSNIAYLNTTHTYKAFANAQANINNSTAFELAFYKPATVGTYDDTVFAPVANGVQLLKDLEDLTIIASIFVVDNVGQRTSLGVSITIDGVVSTIEATGYIRRLSDSNEDLHQVIETFPSLSAGTVITVSKRRQGVASTNASGIEDKGILSVQGVEPDQGTAITGLPTPVITSISLA